MRELSDKEQIAFDWAVTTGELYQEFCDLARHCINKQFRQTQITDLWTHKVRARLLPSLRAGKFEGMGYDWETKPKTGLALALWVHFKNHVGEIEHD